MRTEPIHVKIKGEGYEFGLITYEDVPAKELKEQMEKFAKGEVCNGLD